MRDIFVLLGRRIRQEREALKLSQQQLADEAAIGPTHLSKIEGGKAVPSIRTVKAVADGLRIPMAVLFRDIPAQPRKHDEWTGKIGAMVRDASPGKRKKLFRLIESVLED